MDVTDDFQFGSGGIHRASKRAYLPAALPGQQSNGLLLGVSVLQNAQIPFLASNTMLEKLGCVVDTVCNRLKFEFIGVDIPLDRIHGHYAVNIVKFWHGTSRSHVWNDLSSESLWMAPDPEVIIAAPVAQDLQPESPADALHERSSGMAGALETTGAADDDPAPHDLEAHEQDDWLGDGTQDMAHDVGATAHDGRRPRDKARTCSTPSSTLHPSRVLTVREQVRKVQSVPSVPPDFQVQQRPSRMGAIWRAVVTAPIAVATAISFEYPANQGQGQGQSDQGPRATSQELTPWEEAGWPQEEWENAMGSVTMIDSDDNDPYQDEYDWEGCY